MSFSIKTVQISIVLMEKSRLRDELLNILALMLEPVLKSDLVKEYKNIYASSCLPELKKIGVIKEETKTGLLSLQSYLFKSAIRLHIIPKLEKKELPEWYQIYEKMKKEQK